MVLKIFSGALLFFMFAAHAGISTEKIKTVVNLLNNCTQDDDQVEITRAKFDINKNALLIQIEFVSGVNIGVGISFDELESVRSSDSTYGIMMECQDGEGCIRILKATRNGGKYNIYSNKAQENYNFIACSVKSRKRMIELLND